MTKLARHVIVWPAQKHQKRRLNMAYLRNRFLIRGYYCVYIHVIANTTLTPRIIIHGDDTMYLSLNVLYTISKLANKELNILRAKIKWIPAKSTKKIFTLLAPQHKRPLTWQNITFEDTTTERNPDATKKKNPILRSTLAKPLRQNKLLFMSLTRQLYCGLTQSRSEWENDVGKHG